MDRLYRKTGKSRKGGKYEECVLYEWIVCYSSGQMQLIDSRLLSASRPRITVDGAMLQSTFASLNLSGPGIPPYLPVLPLEPERMVTYNISIPGLQYCSVRPVGLESSQQVLVVGIDVYFNIVPLTL